MKPWMTEAIGTQKVVLPSSVGPGGLGDVGEIGHALEVVEPVELVLVVELERGVERPAGDEVARGAAVEAGIERGVVIRRRRRRELDLDVGVVLVERRDDLRVPDVGVVVAPTLDLQRSGLSRHEPGQQRRERRPAAQNGSRIFHRSLLRCRASCPGLKFHVSMGRRPRERDRQIALASLHKRLGGPRVEPAGR